MAFRRRRREAPLDPGALEAPWRARVEDALASRQRFRALVESAPAGPVLDRLASLDERVEGGVTAAWDIANRAAAAARMLDTMDLGQANARLKDARRRLALDPAVQAEVDVLAEQNAALNSMANSVEAADERLRLVDLRLQAAVARAAQIVLRPDAVDQLGGVDQELTAVTDELAALRAGLDAVGG